MPDSKSFAIWEGVYREWADAQAIEGAFDSPKWLDDQAGLASQGLAEHMECTDTISSNAKSLDYILPTVVAMACKKNKTLKVLDFGGGLATSYLPLVSTLPEGASVEFHVVESQGICERGRKVFPAGMKVYFYSELPSDRQFDIIHAGRSFQYIDDWRSLLTSFEKLKPDYLILAGVLAGDIEPFVSIQNYYDYKIRVRFLNLPELLDQARLLGFNLISKSLHVSKRLGKLGPLPMENFPESRRLEYPCQLLFKLSQL